MMTYLAVAEVPGEFVQMFLEDLELVDSPATAAGWAASIPDGRLAATPVIVRPSWSST